jgi:hypothetical protein
MSAGAYYNGPVADWAKQNIRGRVQVRTLFSSKIGMIVVLALLFCVPLLLSRSDSFNFSWALETAVPLAEHSSAGS